MRQLLFALFMFPVLSSAMATGPGDGEGCRKFEEGLYLRSALSDKGGVTHYLDSLRNCGNDSPEVLLAVGRYLYNQSDYAGAEQTLARLTADATATANQLGEAYYYRGLAAYDQKYYKLSIEHNEKALTAGYKPHWCYNNIGRAYEMTKQYRDALVHYEKALQHQPGYEVAINNIGVVYERMGEGLRSVRYYEMADSIAKGKCALYRSNLTRAYRDLPDLKAELASAAIGYAKFPNDKRILKDQASAICKVGRLDESLAIGRKLLGMGPTTVHDWFDLGSIYSEVGLVDSSAAFYHIVLRMDPDYVNANQNIAIYYKRFGRFDKAHYHLDRALAVNPSHHLAINSKVQTYSWQNDFENAYHWAKVYNEKFPEGPHNHLGMGYVLMQLGRFSEAIPWLEGQLERVPNDDRAINNLGRCYGKLGDTERALAFFDQALAINPDNSFVYHNRASVLCDLGRFDLACEDLQISMDKQYTWTIDSTLLAMRDKHCPHIVTDRKVLVYEYTGNATELKDRSFIELIGAMVDGIETNAAIEIQQEMTVPVDVANTSTSQSTFQVYPNPSMGMFTVEGTALDQADRWVKVFDIQGRTIAHVPMNHDKAKLDLSANGPGTYLLMVMDAGAVLSTRKVVVQ